TAPLPMLLHGVTGSGKTEVYLQAIQTVLDRGQGAIVLVPEISLTPQTADRFKQRFAHIQDQVAILHSHLSHGERHDEWRKVMRRKARIVIGARSAIFAPVENLGLIVVDEEHEHSYKQESPPRYHARDVSVVRAHLEKCAVLLGSATPSLESWRNTLTGKYRLLTMKQRVDNQTLPLIRILDMRQEGRRLDQKSGPAILSIKLRQEMESRLATGEQIILFLNRRGFARSLLCPECGYVAHCRHCALPMTFHQGDNRLVCHLCGYAQISPRRCPECQGQAIALAGYGTERVEEVMRKVFPKARMARVDTDTMRRKNQLRETLDAFKAKKIDILIGTQMIAKGLHFPNVTLVGVLNADIGLNIADFRAGERTFQLLTQVAGRAGRGELEGSVVVQTFTPHHPAIQFSRHHDFEGFADQELDLRERVIFPPFCHLAMVTVRSVHQERAEFSLKTLHRRLAANLPKEISLTEPLPSPLVKSHDQFRFQVTLRAKQARKIAAHVRHVLSGLTFPEDVIVTVDMDAYNLS
ncbi:MAG: primosomal protein N', partial [Verrucomicrobiales bacterium]|nr:primosomal protein N' [Verrucomicrobiales bacterium]